MTAPARAPLTEDQRHAAALAGLGAAPATLRRFLDGYRPADAWAALARGEHSADPGQRYRAPTMAGSPAAVAEACDRAVADVTVLGSPAYPLALAGDRDTPAVLFSRGDLSLLDGRCRVAVVGTRAASRYGLDAAGEIGAGLAHAGVVVVSGLARGVDCAAHAGALSVDGGGAVVAVLGTAVDAPVSPAQAAVRAAVIRRGVVLSELPPGAPERAGGSRCATASWPPSPTSWWSSSAMTGAGRCTPSPPHRARGVPVAAVPGSIRSRASVGTNQLIATGAVAVAGPDDVLRLAAAAGAPCLEVAAPGLRARGAEPGRTGSAAPIDGAGRAVWRSLDHDPALVEVVVRRSGVAVGAVSLALERLAAAGLAREDRGWWSRA